MVATGQCPVCFAVNSFSATNCLDCKSPLPWGNAIADLQKKLDSAQAVNAQVQQQVQQAQQQQAQQNIRTQNWNNPRPTTTRPNSVPLPPGEQLRVNVFHVFADAFVGRFADSLEYLDKTSAAWFGLFCMVVANVCTIIGLRLIMQDAMNVLHAFLPFTATTPQSIPINPFTPPATNSLIPDSNTVPTTPELMAWWKFMAVAFTPWLSIAASCTLARKLFGGEERHLEGDVFIAGVTLLPFSILTLLVGLMGYANWKLSLVLSVFALTYTVLILYRGLTTISLVRDMAAAFCVPLVIMSSAYLAKMVFMRVITM